MSFGYINIGEVLDFQKKLEKFIKDIDEAYLRLNSGFFGACYFCNITYFKDYIQVGGPGEPIPQIPDILVDLKRLNESIEKFIEAYRDEDQ